MGQGRHKPLLCSVPPILSSFSYDWRIVASPDHYTMWEWHKLLLRSVPPFFSSFSYDWRIVATPDHYTIWDQSGTNTFYDFEAFGLQVGGVCAVYATSVWLV